MPFLEVFAFDRELAHREAMSEALTGALAGAYGIAADIVTIYFLPVPNTDYAHAGGLAPARRPADLHQAARLPARLASTAAARAR